MMQGLGAALKAAKDVLSVQLTLGELTFSFWQIFLWTIVAGAVVYIVVKWVS